MNDRDSFAKHALGGLLAQQNVPLLTDSQDSLHHVRGCRERYAIFAKTAYELADAMMKERDVKTK
jgi:hypothetical protein